MDWIWAIFLLLIPTQLGKHFWFNWSLTAGIRSDYLSPTLYLIDLVWLGLVISKRKKIKWKSKGNWLVAAVAVLNIIIAGNKWIAVYRWLRIIQWWITFKLISNDKFLISKYLEKIVPIWIAGESLLGLAQIVKGGSLQGIFYWLGERKFQLETPGIAQIAVDGRDWLRAYGTFSHPNSLAGFLLVAWGWWLFQKDKKNLQPAADPPSAEKTKVQKIWFWGVNWLAVVGIIIAGSRTGWILMIILFLGYWGWNKGSKFKRGNYLGYVGILAGVILMVLGVVGQNYHVSDFVGGWDSDSWSKRVELTKAAGQMIKQNPLLGVGAGNFVTKLPGMKLGTTGNIYWWQPVHNILLLALAEIGILGVVVVGIKLFRKVKIKRKDWWFWGIILVTGMVDHYWLTLPQNTWLLAVMIGIIEKTKKSKA